MTTVFKKIGKDTRNKIFAQYAKSELDVKEDVDILLSWAKSQPHFPEIPTKSMVEFFLVNNKFSIEITKQKLDMYYSIRSLLPDFYKMTNPKNERMRASFETSYVFPLPKLIDGLHRVFFIKIKDEASEFDPIGFVAKMINIQEIRIQEDLMAKQYVLFDMEHLNFYQALKFTPMDAKIGTTVLEKVYSNRIKEIHVINVNPVVTILLKLAKAVLKPKIFDRIKMHENMKTFKKYFPSDVLPKDYGGREKSLEEIQGMWREKFKEYQDRFDIIDTLRVKEGLRPIPMEDIESFGIQGNFKKLNLD